MYYQYEKFMYYLLLEKTAIGRPKYHHSREMNVPQ